jgi:hypothetical protein
MQDFRSKLLIACSGLAVGTLPGVNTYHDFKNSTLLETGYGTAVFTDYALLLGDLEYTRETFSKSMSKVRVSVDLYVVAKSVTARNNLDTTTQTIAKTLERNKLTKTNLAINQPVSVSATQSFTDNIHYQIITINTVLFEDTNLVATTPEYIYVGDTSNNLLVFDVTTPENTTLIYTLALPNIARQIVKVGDKLYIACYTAGVCIVSIANPSRPVITNTVAMEKNKEVSAIAVDGNYIYVLLYTDGLQIFDLTNWALQSEVLYDGIYTSLVYRNKTIYFVEYALGLFIYDVTDVTNPGLLGTDAYYAYIDTLTLGDTNKIYTTSTMYNYYFLIDVTDPTTVVLNNYLEAPGILLSPDIGAANSLLYNATTALTYLNNGNNGFFISSQDLYSVYGCLGTAGELLKSYISGNYAYLCCGSAGLRVIDITDSTEPFLVAKLENIGSIYSINK